MGKLYERMSKFELDINLGVDFTGGSAIVKYIKPDRTTGSFSANVTVLNYATGLIRLTVTSPTDFDVVGRWILWGYATFSDATNSAGEPFEITIYEEGT